MIRINLLQVERTSGKAAKTRGASLNFGAAASKVPLLCSLILIGAVLYVGYTTWSLYQQGQELEMSLAQAKEEEQKLQAVLRQFEAFEARKKQLEQRVKLIEDLRRDQGKAVHLLDKVSTSVPDRLWLTDMKQTGDSIQMDGQTSTLTALADFIGNLENTGYFKRPVEIISSNEEKINAMELIKFQMKADFLMPGSEDKAQAVPVGQGAAAQGAAAPNPVAAGAAAVRR
jgi:type IV pilus assembly protein PilN